MLQVDVAEVVVPCAELAPTLAFFVDELGFRLDAIFPADDPAVACVSGHGLRLRLQRGADGALPTLRLACRALGANAARTLRAPNGMRIELVELGDLGGGAAAPLVVPPLRAEFVLTRLGAAPRWIEGRAGMLYRDLVPGRLGGGLIASHIRIPAGGPVPDSVHYHEIEFQLIYCLAGWVRVVYEDQGEPFVLAAGDCVLQPPRIRHRVLESSPGLEVLELTTPAEHETRIEHELALPNSRVPRARDFAGQRFVRHVGAAAAWQAGERAGFEARDLGIAAATNGRAQVAVVRGAGAPRGEPHARHGELFFGFVLRGTTTLERAGAADERLSAGDAFVLPAGTPHALRNGSRELELFAARLRL